MVTYKYTLVCVCDFPNCSEILEIKNHKSFNFAELDIRRKGWDFKLIDGQITEIYCKLHKHRLKK